jgi:methionyl aminopeptidase
MRNEKSSQWANSNFILLKDEKWLTYQRVAGKIAAQTLVALQNEVANKTTKSLVELNEMAEQMIAKAGGTPTFKGYKGFPAGVCISVNKQLVHGIPSDYHLQEGDVISFDLGVTIEGAIADTAITCIYGTPKSSQHVKLVQSTEEALMKGIGALQAGKRLGSVGNAIYKSAKGNGFGVVTNYGGHGLDWNVPHASPFVQNKSEVEEGIRVQPGLSIAIEPMLLIGQVSTTTLADGWTVVTPDIGAHFEHSVFVHEDRIEIITDRTGL